MRSGGIDAALFAIDVTLARNNHLIYALDALGALDTEIEATDGDVRLALAAGDIRDAKSDDKIAVIMAVENSDATEGGLTTFGVALVKEMNRIGMAVDIAHISEDGYRDVLDNVTVPVINTHTTCAAICNHPRNLTDEQIRMLAGNGGVMGMTFVPHFVHSESPSFEKFIEHIDHAVQLVGPRHVGI